MTLDLPVFGQWVNEFLKVVLSPAPMAVVAAALFYRPIVGLFKTINEIQWGKYRMLMQPQQQVAEPESRDAQGSFSGTGLFVTGGTDHGEGGTTLPPSESAKQLTHGSDEAADKRVVKLQQELMSAKADATLWEHRYLNRFLVANTQAALDWLVATNQPVSSQYFDNMLTTWGIPAQQRTAIAVALIDSRLVSLDEKTAMFEVTPRGREYVAWRGPRVLPQAPIPGGDVAPDTGSPTLNRVTGLTKPPPLKNLGFGDLGERPSHGSEPPPNNMSLGS
jgi:hypothetical protein